MFWHNYRYRIRCNIRNKESLFWTLAFPLLLGTLFYMAFSNLSNSETFSNIKIAVVNNEVYKENISFMTAVSMVSSTNADNALFDVTYTSQEGAEKLLQEDEIAGYIYLDPEIHLVVKKSGIDQTIIKGFLDDYQQSYKTISQLMMLNHEIALENILKEMMLDTNYIKDMAIGGETFDMMLNIFYTLIAMACFFGSFRGLEEVTVLQANLSSQGARVSVAPTHKLKLFLASISAAVTIQFGNILILLAYLNFVLHIHFGHRLGYIIILSLIGSITGVTFGTAVTAVNKKSIGFKMAILVVFTNFMSFLAGMMYYKMKYIIQEKIPLLNDLNPLNLIADGFYSLMFYDTYTQYYKDVFLLCIFSLIFIFLTYMVLRRQKYGNL